MRVGIFGCAALVLATMVGVVPMAAAGTCGGTVACQCGDTVATDYQMTGDLGPCPGHGLTLRSNVTLDCRGFSLRGLANGSEQYGVYFNGGSGNEVRGATMRRCEISGFLRGVRLRSAEGNAVLESLLHENGDTARHVGYGIDVAAGAIGNRIEGNVITANRDEGIHFGTGSGGNDFVGNTVFDNYREQIYLLASHGNRFVGNASYGTGSNSLYLKDSSGNVLEGNVFRDRTARVTGDAHDNVFRDNAFVRATLQFRVYEATPNRIPSNNVVTGGSMTGGDPCLRFTSSPGNAVSDVALSGCDTQVMSEGTPDEPSSNTLIGLALTPSRLQIDSDSTITVGWRVGMQVASPGGAPVAGARVKAVDRLGKTVWEALRDARGDIEEQVLVEYVRVGSVTTTSTPHVVTTAKDGFRPDVRTVTARGDIDLDVVLSAADTPPDDGGNPDPPDPPDDPGTDPPGVPGDFVDDFDRADSVTLGNGWTAVHGALSVAGGEVTSAASISGPQIAVRPSLIGTQQVVEVRLASADNNTNPRLGLVLRYQDASNYYVAYRVAGGTSAVRISKVQGGVERVLSSINLPNPARGSTFRLRAEASGATVSVDVDGVRKLSISDATFGSGSVGLFASASAGKASHRLDEFRASVR